MADMLSGDAPVTADGLVQNYYAEAVFWKMAADMLDSIASQLRRKSYSGAPREAWEDGWSAMRSKLYERELDAFRNLFMFSMTLDAEGREAAKKLAYDRFLRDGMRIIHHLDPLDQIHQYSAAVEQELRSFLDASFGVRRESADAGLAEAGE
jgi:hypothetical protein